MWGFVVRTSRPDIGPKTHRTQPSVDAASKFGLKRLDCDPPVDICWGTNDQKSALRHLHEDYRFGISASGYWISRYRGVDHVMAPGRLQFAEPGETSLCAFDGQAEASYRVIVVSPASLATIDEEIEGRRSHPPHFRDHLVPDAPGWRSFAHVHAELTKPMSRLESSSILRGLIADLLIRNIKQSPRPVKRHDRGLQLARCFLNDQIAANPSLAELAVLAGLSPFHFCRLFRQAFGLPPHAYQNHLRIERAKQLLRSGYPAAAIANDLGFSDQSHFIRHFRRQVGMTPQNYVQGWLDSG